MKTIHHVENRLRALLPDVRIAIAHGQMGETELSNIMHAFVEGRFDVLLCTTIIERGLTFQTAIHCLLKMQNDSVYPISTNSVDASVALPGKRLPILCSHQVAI